MLGHCYLLKDDLKQAYNSYQKALYSLKNPNVSKIKKKKKKKKKIINYF